VLRNRALHFSRIDVVASADDDVFGAANDVQIAFRVFGCKIPGVKPPIGIDRLLRCFGPIEIALHHQGTSDQEFTETDRFVVAPILSGLNGRDTGLHAWQWSTDGAHWASKMPVMSHSRTGKFGHPPQLQQRTSKDALHLRDRLFRDRLPPDGAKRQ
jgi:hypothetical protein